MSTHNIGFSEELTNIIFKLSSNTHIISLSGLNYYRNESYVCGYNQCVNSGESLTN